MFDRLFGRRKPNPEASIDAFHDAMSRGDLVEAERIARDALAAWPDVAPFKILLAQILPRNEVGVAESRRLLGEARDGPELDLAAWEVSVLFALDVDSPSAALRLAREASARTPGDDETARLVFASLARRVYWHESGPKPEDATLRAAHDSVRAVPPLVASSLVESIAENELDGGSVWDRLGPEQEHARAGLDEVDARREELARRPAPLVEVDGRRRRLVDADPFTRASLELFDLEDGVRFVPFAALREVRFERIRLTARAELVHRDGREEELFMPLLYRFHTPEVLEAGMTLWVEVYRDTRVPVGLRDYIELDADRREVGLVSPAHLLSHAWRFVDG